MGLPHLLRSGDPVLQPLAERERAGPQDAAGRVGIADAWWDLAKKEPAPAARHARARAAVWYRAAEPTAKGVALVNVKQRLAQVAGEGIAPAAAAGGGGPVDSAGAVVDLLKLADPAKHAVAGAWTPGDEGLRTEKADHARIRFRYEPPAEYDCLVEYTVHGGRGFVAIIFPQPGSPNAYKVMIKGGTKIGLYGGGKVTPFYVELPARPKPGERVSMQLSVRRNRVIGSFNGQTLFDAPPDYKEIWTLNNVWGLKIPNRLGIGADETAVTIHKAEVREISGEGARPAN